MANRKIDKDRIVELFLKQSKEDKIYIITEMIKRLSEDNANEKLKQENERLKHEINLFKSNTHKAVIKVIEEKLKEKK